MPCFPAHQKTEHLRRCILKRSYLVAAAALALLAWRLATFEWPYTPDGTVDWLIVKAGWDGLNPAAPTFELGQHYQIPGHYSTVLSVTRSPAFFIVHAPVMASLEWSIWIIRALNVAGAVVVGWVAGRLWGTDWWPYALAAAAVGFGAFKWATPELVWAACIAVVWYAAWRGDWKWAGVVLGVVAAVKLWPAILIVAVLALGRRKIAAVATATAGALTGFGLLLPGVSVASTLSALDGGGWATLNADSNLSLSTLLSYIGIPEFATVAAAVVLVWFCRRFGVRRGFGYAVVLGLLASPITWGQYWAAAVPLLPALLTADVETVETQRVPLGAWVS